MPSQQTPQTTHHRAGPRRRRSRLAPILTILFALIALACAACAPRASGQQAQDGKFKVVTTFTVIADIARNVAGVER